jgi:hypothetical protein
MSTDLLTLFSDDDHINLNLDSLRQLSQSIAMNWDKFVRDAPEPWKRDGFITMSTPTSIAIRIGQNTRICTQDSLDDEANIWEQERRYRYIDFLSFAIATDIT